MRRSLVLLALLSSCSDSIGTDPGSGTKTLLVNALVEEDGGSARFTVRVRRGGADVPDADVRVIGAGDPIPLTRSPGENYTAREAGWAGGYWLTVRAGNDTLSGGITAPDPPFLLAPDPTTAFDPHLANGGVVEVRWSGERAMTVRVKTKELEVDGVDAGKLIVPATVFVETQQEITIRRRNTTDLAGGVPGSQLTATVERQQRVLVANPY